MGLLSKGLSGLPPNHPAGIRPTPERRRTITREVVIVIRDDFDGTEGADTYRFGWLGTDYEIDLGPENFKTFEKVMAEYIMAARPPEDSRPPTTRRTNRSNKQRTAELRKIRDWARRMSDQGLPEVGPVGVIPLEVHRAYNRAHPGAEISLPPNKEGTAT